ncbi:MAG: hypothetical protein ABL927_05785, partial [Bdellovibrionales bacterium]
MTSLARHNTPITLIGLICSTVVALIFYFFYGELANQQATLMSLVLGFGLQLSIWLLNDKFGNFSLSLLLSLSGIVILALVPHGIILFSLLSLGLAIVFIRQIWANKLNCPQFKDIKSLSSGWLTVILGITYGIIVFVSTSSQVGDGLINEKIRQFTLNPDTLFHSSMSLMIRNYFTVSTGLHGLVKVHYHFLSHGLYAYTSQLLRIEPYEVYGYTNFIVFAPLLITSWLNVLASIRSDSKYSFAICNLILIGGPLSQSFGYLWSSHFISESYLLGLILLAGITYSFIRFVEKNTISAQDLFLSVIYIFSVS